MIQHLKHKDIDKRKWDELLLESKNSRVYAQSWYLDMVCPEWEALISEDAIFPLTIKRKYGFKACLQPPFAQQLGVFSKKRLSKQKQEKFLFSIPSHVVKTEIYLNSAHIKASYLKDRTNYILKPRKAKYNQNTKRNLQKANDAALWNTPLVRIKEFIDLHKENIGNLKKAQYTMFAELLEQCFFKGYLIQYSIKNLQQETLCTGMFLRDKDRHVYLGGAANSLGKSSGAMHFMMHTAIEEAFSENKMLDFEGSMIPGIARFFEGFGAEKEVYYHYSKSRLKWI